MVYSYTTSVVTLYAATWGWIVTLVIDGRSSVLSKGYGDEPIASFLYIRQIVAFFIFLSLLTLHHFRAQTFKCLSLKFILLNVFKRTLCEEQIVCLFRRGNSVVSICIVTVVSYPHSPSDYGGKMVPHHNLVL